MQSNREIRSIRAEARVARAENGDRVIKGLIPYNTESVDLGGFIEKILPGAFASALEPGADVICLRDHDEKFLMGRSKSGTLKLEDSPEGLRYTVDPPNTQYARDLVESMERGDLDACSFSFVSDRNAEKWGPAEGRNGLQLRQLGKVELLEVSPCSFAAYPASQVSLRNCPPEIRSKIRPERRYRKVCSAVASTPWAILPEKLATIHAILEMRANGGQMTEREIRAAMMGAKDNAPQTVNSVAILPVYGTIAQRMDLFMEFSGGTSCQSLSAAFRAALADSSVKAIVLDVDSPGGTVSGVPELAAEIMAARGTKPVIAVANSMAASAAYFIAACADELVVTPSGEVGSIGVYSGHEDMSEMLEKAGVKITLVSAGDFKTEGNPYEPLSDAARADMQSHVDGYYKMFVAAVAAGRKTTIADVLENFGQGRMLMAKDAVKVGMADRIGTLDEVLASLGAIDPRTDSAASAAGAIAAVVECGCGCDACEGGDCENCSEEECDDEDCVGCPNQDEDEDGDGSDGDDDEGYLSRMHMNFELRKRRMTA
jgi:HK97 family phage prohead protease